MRLYSRRDFGKLALALPAAGPGGGFGAAFAFQAKPNSVCVPFGIFAPYRFGPEASDLEGVLKALVKFGVSQTELSNAVVERYVGAPQPAARAGGAGAAGQAAGGGGRARRGRRRRPPPLARPGAIPCTNGVPDAGAARAGGGGGAEADARRRRPSNRRRQRAQAEGAGEVAHVGADEQVRRGPARSSPTPA